jgi:hypothetical protein
MRSEMMEMKMEEKIQYLRAASDDGRNGRDRSRENEKKIIGPLCTSRRASEGSALEFEAGTIKTGGEPEGQDSAHSVEDVDRMTATDLRQGSVRGGVEEKRKRGKWWCLDAPSTNDE